MSRAGVTIKFRDGYELYTLYDGTNDVIYTSLVEGSTNNAWATFPKYEDEPDKFRKCTCGSLEPITVQCQYGLDHEWQGQACRKCKAYEGPRNGYDTLDQTQRGYL